MEENNKQFLNDLLGNLAWPAIAGNVAWSFATLAIEFGIDPNTVPRLLILLLLAVYLVAEWYRSLKAASNSANDPTLLSLYLDIVFVVFVIWFAIATNADKGLPGLAFILLLAEVGIGHIFGLWPPAGKGKGNIPHGAVSLVASIILGFAWYRCGAWDPWVACIAMVVVLGVWFKVRRGKV